MIDCSHARFTLILLDFEQLFFINNVISWIAFIREWVCRRRVWVQEGGMGGRGWHGWERVAWVGGQP